MLLRVFAALFRDRKGGLKSSCMTSPSGPWRGSKTHAMVGVTG